MTSTKYQFKAARVLAGLTQRELSEKSGVSMTTIVKIDNGVYNDLTPLRKIAKVLNKTISINLN
jgi:DNA-binding XRE family transcriptional regulator